MHEIDDSFPAKERQKKKKKWEKKKEIWKHCSDFWCSIEHQQATILLRFIALFCILRARRRVM